MSGNAKEITDYLTQHEATEGITPGWRNSLQAVLRRIASYSRKPPADWDTDEVLKITTGIRKSAYSANYKRNLVRHLKPFVLWLAKSNTKISTEAIRAIRIPDAVWKTKKPEDMLTVDEVTAVIKAGNNPRDRCLMAMLYDTSCRPVEILSLKWSDLERDEHGVFFSTRAKTGKERRIRLTNISLPLLNEWQNLHPEVKPHAYVFRPGVFKGKEKNRPMTKSGFDNLIEHIRHRTGITKLKPGIMRSVRITHDVRAGYPTQYIMLKNWGSLKTKMLDLYANPGKDYIDQTALRQAGMVRVAESKNKETYKLEVPVCPACDTVNLVGSMWCSHCQGPLTPEAKGTIESTRERIHADEAYTDRLTRLEAELAELKKRK
jgi:integrase/recombinase XerD